MNISLTLQSHGSQSMEGRHCSRRAQGAIYLKIHGYADSLSFCAPLLIYNFLDMADLKKPPFEKINVNGRVPAIEDPNTGITLWESGAIIEYLVETYDPKATLTYTSSPEKFHVKQWLYFQMSGQGPYFGQAVWFAKFHPERIASATDRYKDQVKRVFHVLDMALQGKQYLVGDKWYVFSD
jgi:glutathione S-transferase